MSQDLGVPLQAELLGIYRHIEPTTLARSSSSVRAMRATPVSTAAKPTATATAGTTLGSKGLGIT